MTPRERIIKCIEHQEPDRVPLGGSFRPEIVKKLQDHFATKDLGKIYDELGIDWRGGAGMGASAEFRERCKASGGSGTILCPDGSYEDEWGVRMKQILTSSPYEAFVYQPLKDDETRLKTYRFPDPTLPERWTGIEQRVAEQKKKWYVGAGVSTLFKAGWHLRGLQNWLADLVSNEPFVTALLDKMEEYETYIVRRCAEAGVDYISMGGDIAMQKTLFMSPATWRKHFKPRDARILNEAKKRGIRHFYFHTDGNLWPVMDDLIEIGFDIIDPIQPECMNPYEVKEKYGDRITLHGTISSQHTLPFGAVDDVRREVEERIRRCGRGGGLVISPNNVVQYDVPLKNLLAVYETAKQMTYPL